MDASFIPIETVPSKTPFGLDQLRRSYKTALSAEDAIAAAPAVGAADEVFPCMFLMPISTPESAESATRIDLLYMGCIAFTGTGVEGDPFLPVLPDQKHEDQDQVQSANSSKGNAGQVLSSPITAQYYAPSSVLTWFTFGARGVKGTAADPDRPIAIITVTIGDSTFSFDTANIDTLIATFFSSQITDSIDSQEIVPGQYWQNTERKTLTLIPYLISLPPGFYPAAYAAGSGYTPGDVITVTGTGSCVMNVISVFTAPSGGIQATTIVSNSLSAATSTPISATGGTGTGAKYTVIHVT